MGERPNVLLAMNALDMALLKRLPPPGLVHHTDQGPLYSAHAYRERLERSGLNPSMSAKGNAYDNAVAESFFLQSEERARTSLRFRQPGTGRSAIFDYIEIFYNRQRRDQTLRYVSPLQSEQINGISY